MAFNTPRVRFGRNKAGEDKAPLPHLLAGAAARKAERLPKAENVLAALPGPGASLHALMTGRYDLMDMVAAVVAGRGPVLSLSASTLSFHAKNLVTLLDLFDAGRVAAIHVLCCTFFRNTNRGLWGTALAEFRTRGQRIAAARTHAKVVTLALADGTRYAIEGSANLRHNDCREQIAVVNDAGVHDFHAGWIGELIARHEGDEKDAEEGTGAPQGGR